MRVPFGLGTLAAVGVLTLAGVYGPSAGVPVWRAIPHLLRHGWRAPLVTPGSVAVVVMVAVFMGYVGGAIDGSAPRPDPDRREPPADT